MWKRLQAQTLVSKHGTSDHHSITIDLNVWEKTHPSKSSRKKTAEVFFAPGIRKKGSYQLLDDLRLMIPGSWTPLHHFLFFCINPTNHPSRDTQWRVSRMMGSFPGFQRWIYGKVCWFFWLLQSLNIIIGGALFVFGVVKNPASPLVGGGSLSPQPWNLMTNRNPIKTLKICFLC